MRLPLLPIFPFFAILFLFGCGPNLARYQPLVDPAITVRPDERMLIVTGQGDPDGWMKEAISDLYKTWFKWKRQYGLPDAAPKARFPKDLELADKSTWRGEVGLPVPDTIENDSVPPKGRLKLTTWSYGPTAEILHLGPYAGETATIARLKAYITNQGYRIVGMHEEEYLKGPGLFGKGNPLKYQTLIRYRVEKAPGR